MAASKKLNLSFFIGVLKRYLLAVALSGIFCGTEGFLLSSFTISRQYESRAVIRMEGGKQSGDSSQYFLNACKVVLESAVIRNDLTANLDLPYTKEQLNEMISADITDTEGEIALIVRCGDADDAQSIANELLDLAVQEFNRVQTFGTASVASYGKSSSLPVPRSRVLELTVAALLGGAAAAYIIAIIHDLSDIVVRTGDDLEKLFGFPALGAIPKAEPEAQDEKSEKNIISGNYSENVLKAYDSAREALISAIPQDAKKIIAVTSPKDSEGKTTVCSELAKCFAGAGFKTLLVECDMIKPGIYKKFKLRSRFGLSSVLEGVCSVSKAINEEVVENLDIISSGKIPKDHTELIGSDNMKTFLEASSENYSYVLLDTPSVNSSEDPLLINEAIAGFILVIKENSTTRTDIESAIDKIELSKGNILGLVKTFSCI